MYLFSPTDSEGIPQPWSVQQLSPLLGSVQRRDNFSSWAGAACHSFPWVNNKKKLQFSPGPFNTVPPPIPLRFNVWLTLMFNVGRILIDMDTNSTQTMPTHYTLLSAWREPWMLTWFFFGVMGGSPPPPPPKGIWCAHYNTFCTCMSLVEIGDGEGGMGGRKGREAKSWNKPWSLYSTSDTLFTIIMCMTVNSLSCSTRSRLYLVSKTQDSQSNYPLLVQHHSILQRRGSLSLLQK